MEEGRYGRVGAVDNFPNFCPEPSFVDTNTDENDIPVANGLTASSSSHTFDDSLRRVAWFRKPKHRADGSCDDIYYYEDGRDKR